MSGVVKITVDDRGRNVVETFYLDIEECKMFNTIMKNKHFNYEKTIKYALGILYGLFEGD